MTALAPGAPPRAAAWTPGRLALTVTAGRRLRLRTLVLIHWLALAGQTLALLFVHFGLGFHLPLAPALSVVGISVIVNLGSFALFPASYRLHETGAGLYLGFDIVQLAVLLYLTGGLENPFALLFLVPVTISATILSLRSTVALGLLGVVAVTVLGLVFQPLPWGAGGLVLPTVYIAGTWAAIVLGICFLSIYAWQVAAETRRMSDALGATQLALARAQQLSALGGLAAAAAHELGTPLGTIVLVAKEIARELPPTSLLAEDISLLVDQAERCRDILTRLSHRPEKAEDAFAYLPLTALVDMAASPCRRDTTELTITPVSDGAPPIIGRQPEILHGLGNLIQNALDFARAEVVIALAWDVNWIRILVRDDGPGIRPEIIGALGDPYITSRADQGGMGLGVFIAKTLLEHTGAQVTFANPPSGGCEVAIQWRRGIVEAPPERRSGSEQW